VPYPFAAGDHQTANARALEEAGAAVLIPQSRLSGPALAGAVTALVRDPARRKGMARAAGANARPDAALRVAEEALGAFGGAVKC
jgi:UDP-N-acetylglucosamine--N-acetylmuramyl-(pentapeptide) pyrophosphoryl-undecaprenol N-acetylglucosamine transferase